MLFSYQTAILSFSSSPPSYPQITRYIRLVGSFLSEQFVCAVGSRTKKFSLVFVLNLSEMRA